METLQAVIDYILGFGAPVFVPLIMLIVGLAVRMRFREAFNSAITLGIAFIGMSLVITFMMDSIGPAAHQFVENTGIQLNAIDGGWTSVASLAWAWPLAFLIFPLQLGINLLMIVFNWTKTLNVDLWNVWAKILTAVLIYGVSQSYTLAFIVAAIQVVVELKLGDANQKHIEHLTQIPGVTVTHGKNIIGPALYPLNRLLDFIPGLNKKVDTDTLKERFGVFAEAHVMGFIIGILLGIVAKFNPQETLTLAVKAAAALMLFPMVAKLFMQALSPLSDAISEFMRNKFSGRELFIGLDWPILAGRNEIWVAAIILVPITLVQAVILPGNNVLPFAGIINTCILIPAAILTGGNLLRMIILGIVFTPLMLLSASFFAPIITDLAISTGVVEVPAGQMLTWSSIESPLFRWIFAIAAEGKILGIALAVIWGVVLFWYYKAMMKKAELLNLEEDDEEVFIEKSYKQKA